LAYNISYKGSIQRDLKKVSKAEARRVLDQIEEELSQNVEVYPMLKGRFAGLRKYRVGDYRVLYALLGNEVIVLRIGHRKDVYKQKI
jgi:mRNA interferase RelE/StbE